MRSKTQRTQYSAPPTHRADSLVHCQSEYLMAQMADSQPPQTSHVELDQTTSKRLRTLPTQQAESDRLKYFTLWHIFEVELILITINELITLTKHTPTKSVVCRAAYTVSGFPCWRETEHFIMVLSTTIALRMHIFYIFLEHGTLSHTYC